MAIGPVVSAKLKVKSLLVDDAGEEPTFLSQTGAVLPAIRSLRPDENLVLFTPVVAPARPPEPGDLPSDPFEAFGRALCKSHRRIQHVPFVPAVGLTDTHVAFLRHASAVIAVACDPRSAGAGGGSNGTSPSTILQGIIRFREQLAFARALQHVATMPCGDAEDAGAGVGPPLLLLLVEGPMIQESPADIGSFDTILRCSSYGPETLARAANAIFEPPALTKTVPDRSRGQGV